MISIIPDDVDIQPSCRSEWFLAGSNKKWIRHSTKAAVAECWSQLPGSASSHGPHKIANSWKKRGKQFFSSHHLAMALSHMQYVVITTTVLIALDHIASHEIYRDAVSNGVWADTMWLNFTNSWNTTTLQESIAATKAGLNPIETWLNEATIHHSKPYYLGSFPRTMFTYALCVPLQQYWNIYLERLLPTRSRRRDVSYQEKQAGGPVGEDGAGREEEIVNRWIAQGKVRRSSFNKCNTFLKWILDITVGKVLYEVVYHTIEGMLERELTWNHLMEVSYPFLST